MPQVVLHLVLPPLREGQRRRHNSVMQFLNDTITAIWEAAVSARLLMLGAAVLGAWFAWRHRRLR